MKKSVIIGREYDEDLKNSLKIVLKSMGSVEKDFKRLLVGSQDIQFLSISIDGHIIEIESETYIGLSLTGESEIIDKILSKLNKNNN